MALDGIFLSKVKDELLMKAVGLKVDKVQMPTKDEVVLNLRSRQGAYRLLICVRADSARVHFTSHAIDNPPVPPMFCMLMRKRLTGAVITDIRQSELDRILFIDFDATNEIGDRVKLTLVTEIMGKYSNMILLSEDGKIIDSMKRVDISTSSVRQILPGLVYEPAPKQDKLCLETADVNAVFDRILSYPGKLLSSAVLSSVQGISPIIAREIAFRCTGDDTAVGSLNETEKKKLSDSLEKIKNGLHKEPNVWMLLSEDGKKPKDMSFLPVCQYGDTLGVKEYDSPSTLLDDFYFERDRINRINHRGHELIKLLKNLIERTARKLNLQKQEYEKCGEKDTLKLYAELITANAYALKKGSVFYDVPNYYDNMNTVRISVNPALTPTENANKYYKDYRKAKTAEGMLEKLIKEGEDELVYLESVLDELSRADTDSEISSVRLELCEGGYLKNKSGKKQKPPKSLPPYEFMSTDGYRILVGRNNIQNDRLSMKTANNNDMWLHTQSFPGSHVIIENQGGEVSDLSIEQAAVIAAYYSKARESTLVPVDYTKVRNLKKPVGAKPGKVIYHVYYTIIVNPDEKLVENLKVK